MPLHVQFRTWEHFWPTVAWNDPLGKFYHLDTSSRFFHPIRELRFLVPSMGTWLESIQRIKWTINCVYSDTKRLNCAPYDFTISLTSNSTSNSYFSKLCMLQHLPNHFVPSLFDSKRNQSVPESLLFWTYWKLHKIVSYNGLNNNLQPKGWTYVYLDQCLIFLFQSLYPQLFVAWTSLCLQ